MVEMEALVRAVAYELERRHGLDEAVEIALDLLNLSISREQLSFWQSVRDSLRDQRDGVGQW